MMQKGGIVKYMMEDGRKEEVAWVSEGKKLGGWRRKRKEKSKERLSKNK